MADLETVDLHGVEILSTGGPVHGVGSPPEGDFWTEDQLRAMAEAAQELESAGEWRVPARVDGEPLGRNKLGHDKNQTLLSTGELPAAGWLTNQRVSEDGTRLLTDVVDVPKRIADLIKARAYRTRSSELSRITSQKTGKRYDWVVTGLAWLGGKMPAVRTLDDVVAMYTDDGVEPKFLQMDEQSADVEALRDLLAKDGDVEIVSRAESRASMADDKTITTDDLAPLAEVLGVEGEVTVESLTAAAETRNNELADAKAKADEAEQRKNEADDATTKLAELEKRFEASERRAFEMERDSEIGDAMKDGRLKPADKEKWEKRYESNPELTKELLSEMDPDPTLRREFGSDDDGRDGDDDVTRAFEADLALSMGVPAEELI